MRTMLRGKISFLVIVCAVLLAIPAIALADALRGDADSDALAAPGANEVTANQAPGSTATYNFDAFIANTGSTANDVFKDPGDYVKVSIARSGDWLNTSDSGSPSNPSQFIFTKYTADDTLPTTPDNTQAGTIKVKVPCTASTTAGSADSRTMTAALTAEAWNAGPDNQIGTADDTLLPNGGGPSIPNRQLSPNTQTFTYTVTASGSPVNCKEATSLSLSANPNEAFYGDPVDLTATLTKTSDSSAISGKTITFKDGTTALCDAVATTPEPACPQTDANGAATLQVSNLSVGSHNNITASFAEDNDYFGSNAGPVTVTIKPWTRSGFHSPVDMGIMNYAKGGSTVPLKFEVFKGTTELTDPDAIANYFTQKISCAAGQGDDIEQYTSGSTGLRYDSTGGQFILNWKTLKAPGTCYRVTLETKDGQSIYADFQLK